MELRNGKYQKKNFRRTRYKVLMRKKMNLAILSSFITQNFLNFDSIYNGYL